MEDEKKLLQVENEKENTKVGAPADSFNGLPMGKLISAPLIAVSEAQQQLAETTMDFYNKIAFENDGKKRCLEFDLEHPVQVPDGIGMQEVPVPAFMMDNVNINFQMEVIDVSTSNSAENAELSTDVTSKQFRASIKVQENVGTSRENTRSNDRTAKYQISASAKQQPQAEGLSKLRDIMASYIEPLDTKE